MDDQWPASDDGLSEKAEAQIDAANAERETREAREQKRVAETTPEEDG
jgi:hypothetical protein